MPRLTVDDSILAISDVHTAPAGRLLAQKLLNTGVVSVFFMEWSKPIDPRNVTDSFTGLSPNDARPNLRGLATICAAENIEMVPCDLSVDRTVEKLNGLNDVYGPYNDGSAIKPWGESIRDEHAAEVIADYMAAHPRAWGHALLMFGADHFLALGGRLKLPLHKLIKARIGRQHNVYLISSPGLIPEDEQLV
jgi:hypothetical protein